MSQFKHNPNKGILFYQDDSLGTSKPNWSGDIAIGDDVLKMLLDDRKKHNEPPLLSLEGWNKKDNGKEWINLSTSTWKKKSTQQSGEDPQREDQKEPVQTLDDKIPF